MKISKQYKTRLNTDKAFWIGGSFEGVIDDNIRVIEKVQLKDAHLWKTLASFFGTNLDDADLGWRCEYWGKIMRGAAWVYEYTKDEELYNILTDTVRDLLTRQDEYGRFATYSLDAEFSGWDIWGRKYVIMGLLHYYDICRDDELKAEIVDAMMKHTDYIIDHIGEDKKDILETSHFWGCLNSASILEPIVRLYNLTEEERYLDFAEYIVKTGFCKDFNLIETAYEDKLAPYEYPVTKAYEMMSCMEGLIEYWRIKGNDKYIQAAKKFVDRIIETDISIIGCAGCYSEEFNHGALKQSDDEYTDIMQETCVTVTWMKLCGQMYCVTGDVKYIEEIEKSAYNAMLGSVNGEMVEVRGRRLPFDSYSPLILGRRGAVVGGLKTVGDFSYGCCTAIGSAGLGLVPKMAVMETKKGLNINMYMTGRVETEFDGTAICLDIKEDIAGRIKISVHCGKPLEFELKLRIPSYAENVSVKVNGQTYKCDNVCTIAKTFDKDELEILYTPKFEVIKPLSPDHKYIAFKYGKYVLARDIRFCKDTGKEVVFDEETLAAKVTAVKGEKYRIKAVIRDKNGIVTEMIDYASAGKTLEEDSLMEAWLPVYFRH